MKISKDAKILLISDASKILYAHHNYHYCQPAGDLNYGWQVLFSVCSINNDEQRVEYHVIQKGKSNKCVILKKERIGDDNFSKLLNEKDFEEEFS